MSGSVRILRKAREIILAKSEGELSLHARRLFNLLLYRAMAAGKSRALADGIHRVAVKEMMEYVGGQSWEKLDEALNDLATASLTMDYVDGDGNRNTSKIHYLSYHMTHSSDGWVNYAFDPLLLRFVYDPQVFALMSLTDLRSFRTSSGARLYEVLALRVRRKVGVDWEVTIDEFREQMQVADDEYLRFDNLRVRVIEPAVDEINEIAPFRVDVKFLRSGRGGRVTGIVFMPRMKGLSVLAGRDAAAITARSSGRKGKAERQASDDLFGLSEGERKGGLTDDALEAASRLMPGEDIIPMVDEWIGEMRNRTVLRPDKSFLSWLESRLAGRNGGLPDGMEQGDSDAFIRDWIEG